MSPITWEQATEDVAVALAPFSNGTDWTLPEVLSEVEECLDILRKGTDLEEELFRNLAWYGAVGYVLEKNEDFRTAIAFVERCEDAVRSVLVLLPKKQHDYGPDNILWGGVQGVVVRAHDKLARIKNLRERAHQAGGEVVGYNEPLADSYFDLIGYGIVGAMLVNGTFQLPLKADMPEVETLAPSGQLYDFNGLKYRVGDEPKTEPTMEDDIRRIVREELLALVLDKAVFKSIEEQMRELATEVAMEITHEGFDSAERAEICSIVLESVMSHVDAWHKAQPIQQPPYTPYTPYTKPWIFT